MWHAWERKMYNIFVGKPQGKRPHGKPRRRWEDDIKVDRREMDWEGGVD
jgi:hypothetical protein